MALAAASMLTGCQELHELSGVATMAKRPQTTCVERVLKAQPGDDPVDIHHRYVGKRNAREYGAKAETLADWVEYWLPDTGVQMMIGIVPRNDGGATIISDVTWMGPDATQDQIASYYRQQRAVEAALSQQCGVDFSHAERHYRGKDVERYFRR